MSNLQRETFQFSISGVWRLQGSAGTRRSICLSADCVPFESCDDGVSSVRATDDTAHSHTGKAPTHVSVSDYKLNRSSRRSGDIFIHTQVKQQPQAYIHPPANIKTIASLQTHVPVMLCVFLHVADVSLQNNQGGREK